ncbi:MAG TPA: diphthine synthase [Euryarchaeota archaeon]|nr:diphthine synthase [Euryarchaeota archaeon]
MGKIVLIGLGLHDEKSITLEALECAKGCDMLFAEQYTSLLAEGSIERLERRIGKEIQLLDRKRIEDGSFLILAREMAIGLLIPGDPMTATTHVDLRIRAHEKDIECEIVHGTSVIVAVPGILGLQHYKFGRTVTIPFNEAGYDPTSPLELLMKNLENGLHTLALLDIQADKERYMTANEGLEWILRTAEKLGYDVIGENLLACVVARAGSKDCMARADKLSELIKMEFGPPLHTIVIPGKLHFQETEALIRLAKAPPELFMKL